VLILGLGAGTISLSERKISQGPGDATLKAVLIETTGTVVLWEALDRIIGARRPGGEAAARRLEQTADELAEHLAMVFPSGPAHSVQRMEPAAHHRRTHQAGSDRSRHPPLRADHAFRTNVAESSVGLPTSAPAAASACRRSRRARPDAYRARVRLVPEASAAERIGLSVGDHNTRIRLTPSALEEFCCRQGRRYDAAFAKPAVAAASSSSHPLSTMLGGGGLCRSAAMLRSIPTSR
jgi:hypothetical protein